MRLRSLFVFLVFLCFSAMSYADSMTYTFTYNGVGENGLSDPGSGSFSYDYMPGFATATLTAFDFTDTLHGLDGSSSTYSYTMSSVLLSASSISIGSDGAVTALAIYTDDLTGSNESYPTTAFLMTYGVQGFSSATQTSTTSAVHYTDANSDGDVTLTPVPKIASTTEPSSFVLLGTGLVSIAGVVRKRFA